MSARVLMLLDEIAVGQHDALGHAGRPGGVDERGHVARPDRQGARFEKDGTGPSAMARPFSRTAASGSAPAGAASEEDDPIPDLGQGGPDGLDLRPEGGGRAQDDRGVGVVDDVADLLGDERRIDRDGDRAQAEVGEIGDDPTRAVVGEDDDFVARPCRRGRPAPERGRRTPDRPRRSRGARSGPGPCDAARSGLT